LEADHGR
jgi:hypothetical protein